QPAEVAAALPHLDRGDRGAPRVRGRADPAQGDRQPGRAPGRPSRRPRLPSLSGSQNCRWLDPPTLDVEQALAAGSRIDAEGVQAALLWAVSVGRLPEAVPRTPVTVEPLSDIVEPLKVALLVVTSTLSSTLPSAAPLTLSRSPDALLAIVTV